MIWDYEISPVSNLKISQDVAGEILQERILKIGWDLESRSIQKEPKHVGLFDLEKQHTGQLQGDIGILKDQKAWEKQ